MIFQRLRDELSFPPALESGKQPSLLDAEVGLDVRLELLPNLPFQRGETGRIRRLRIAAEPAREHEGAVVLVRERLQRGVALHDYPGLPSGRGFVRIPEYWMAKSAKAAAQASPLTPSSPRWISASRNGATTRTAAAA